ncbi:peroxisomal membrane protein PEX14-like isoform X3 [Phragmites australis]|uniref:peroxisomal membrane protein PEX14-like isoform X3 n=1 Tax=Phragmites australis TaxID=29695 RepID=UPI002D7972B1|nr:peroxisomal membrane protein PEX14-like isoform X3 [Phragmites australis]
MADVSTSSDAEVAEEARQQEAEVKLCAELHIGQGSSEGIHTTTLQDTKEQEIRKGKAALASFELMREELVQSAVGFLKHPKVVASSDVQRLSFLENKGLTVDEINEAFRRLQETKVVPKCMDGEKLEPETEPVAPVVPHHPKSYMEIMEMIQRGERPDDIQDINDNPPNPDQPISEPRMAPKPKPWEKQDQENSTWDLKSLLSDSSELRPEVGNDSTHPATESANGSNQGDSLLQTIVVVGSESPTTDAASSK